MPCNAFLRQMPRQGKGKGQATVQIVEPVPGDGGEREGQAPFAPEEMVQRCIQRQKGCGGECYHNPEHWPTLCSQRRY